MIQHNQIGKYKKKESVLDAKIGKLFVLPSGKKYEFTEYKKIGRKYIFIITYLNHRCQISESDYFKMDMDKFLTQMETDILIN